MKTWTKYLAAAAIFLNLTAVLATLVNEDYGWAIFHAALALLVWSTCFNGFEPRPHKESYKVSTYQVGSKKITHVENPWDKVARKRKE